MFLLREKAEFIMFCCCAMLVVTFVIAMHTVKTSFGLDDFNLDFR